MTFEQALSYCETLNIGGHTDWRLPTTKELRSLVDYSHYGPSINTTYFPNTQSSDFLSSTTYATSTNYVIAVYFDHGYDDAASYDRNDFCNVRAVRGGQPETLPLLSVSPTNQAVSNDAGTATFNVSNTGAGTMSWTAAVTSSGSWLSITSGSSGTDSGTITCAFSANAGTAARTGTIRVTAAGAAAVRKM